MTEMLRAVILSSKDGPCYEVARWDLEAGTPTLPAAG